MTRINTGKRYNGSNGSQRIATLHRCDGVIAAILAQSKGTTISIQDTATIPESNTSGLKTRLESWKPDIIINVLPGGSVISRVIEVPTVADGDAQFDAAVLQAEVEMPPQLPDHRRSVAMLPWESPSGASTGLALGWLGEAPTMPVIGETPVPIYFTGQAACLAELLIASGSNGLLAFAGRKRGSVELVSRLAQNLTVRTANVDQHDWSGALARIMIETALSSGAPDATVDSIERTADTAQTADATLISDPDIASMLASRITGSKKDAAWWNQFGLCVGAALGALGSRGANFALLSEAPESAHGVFNNAANWLAVPRNATRLLVASVILILVLPLASAWLRYTILDMKIGNLKVVKAHADEQVATAEFFRVLNDQRWPMTKLLADLSTMAWYDLDIDSIYIDTASNITLSGDAPLNQRERVNEFHRNLSNSSVFKDVRQPQFKSGDNKIDFEFQVGVQSALVDTERPYDDPLGSVMYRDFGDTPPGDYIFNAFAKGRSSRVNIMPTNDGDENANDPPIDIGEPEPDESFGTENSSGTGLDFSGLETSTPSNRNTGRPSRNVIPSDDGPVSIPIGQLTDDLIAKMDRDSVVRAMTERGPVKSKDAVANDEYNKLVKRFQQINSQQNSGGLEPAAGGPN